MLRSAGNAAGKALRQGFNGAEGASSTLSQASIEI